MFDCYYKYTGHWNNILHYNYMYMGSATPRDVWPSTDLVALELI